jgi:hypothetical protein
MGLMRYGMPALQPELPIRIYVMKIRIQADKKFHFSNNYQTMVKDALNYTDV